MRLPLALRRVHAIATKEWLHMIRDRLTFVSLIIGTASYLIVFGYAINPDPRYIETVVVDHDKSEFSRLYRASLQQSRYLSIDPREMSADQASDWLRRGKTSVVIEIPPDFTANLMAGKQAQILVEADASDPVSLNGAISSTSEVARTVAAHVLRRDGIDQASPSVATIGSNIDVRVQRRFNPKGEHTYYVVPALVGMVLNMSLLIMTAMSITKEKEQGSMEFLLVTPTAPWEIVIGKIIPNFGLGVLQVLMVLGLAIGLFGVPLTGTVAALGALTLLYGLTTLAVGILLSTRAQSQMQAMQLSFYYFMPSIFLSGFMFPYSGLPAWAKVIADGLPMTYFVRGARGVFLKEYTLIDMWPNLWPIAIALVVFTTLAIKGFKRTLG